VEELLFARGIMVTYEAIRKWCRKFGQQYARRLCRRPTSSPHPTTVKQCGNSSALGRNSPPFPPPYRGYDSGSRVSSYRVIMSISNKLTMPLRRAPGQRPRPAAIGSCAALSSRLRPSHKVQCRTDASTGRLGSGSPAGDSSAQALGRKGKCAYPARARFPALHWAPSAHVTPQGGQARLGGHSAEDPRPVVSKSGWPAADGLWHHTPSDYSWAGG
jgi:hypothetical protein